MKKFYILFALAALLSAIAAGTVSAQKRSSGTVKEISAKNFNAETKKGVVVVDFWATWCGPCRMMSPIFTEVAKQFSSRAKFAKIDVDKAREIAGAYNITAIPCIIIFVNGKEQDRLVGYKEKQELIDAVSKYTR